MAKFNVGDSVVNPESGEHGIIIMVAPPRRGGRQLYTVNWGSYNSDELEEDLVPDCDLSDPYMRCSRGIFDSYSEYSKKNTTFKIKNSNNSTISSLKASKTLFRPYQFKPLLKFLNSPIRRLLVADEVGLGKTIEAGHIMLEIKARGELRNVLIVCPKSLQEKWKAELSEKFALTFKIYESSKDLIQDMKDHNGMVRAIVNYEKIRIKDSEEGVPSSKNSKQKKPSNLVDYLLESNFKFSLVLCDEAHKMRNKETQTYKGAEVIMNQTAAAVFLTATPVMISTENLYNLLHLLDNTRYFNYQIFENRLQENRPFVEALTALNHRVPFKEIAEHLWNAEIYIKYLNSDNEVYYSEIKTVGESYKDDETLEEIMNLLKGEATPQVEARLQYLISSMSVMNSIFSRTRKKEVTRDLSQAKREPTPCKIILNEAEREEFDAVIEQYEDDNSYIDEYMEERLSPGKALGLVQKKRQVASSVYAYLNEEEDLDDGYDAFAGCEDAKVSELLNIIDKVFSWGTKKLVVFALFRKTLKYLKIRLAKAGHQSLIIHGQIENRADILEQFRTDENAHILLSSEVGSEGLDMQFCNSMVNYDLPWNPMVVEQRIGRIDRFGQTSPIVHIFNMIVADSIQEQIYMRLLERIGIFQGTIGDMEAILDANYQSGSTQTIQDVYNKLEKQLLTNKLTKAEMEEKLKDVERAIENEKENIRHLEPGLNNTLTNDSYFQDEINRIKNNNAYVTDIELCNYLEAAIRHELKHCELVKRSDNIYELQMKNDPRQLYNFLLKYRPVGEEMEYVFRRFVREIENKESLLITFNQETAYENRKVMYLNIYHPIIQACLIYFINSEDSRKTSFSYGLPSNDILKSGEAYYMAIYQLTTIREVQGIEKKTETLIPLLYDISKGIIVDNLEISDRVFADSQIVGMEHNPNNVQIEEDMLVDMRYAFLDKIKEIKRSQERELTRIAEGDRKRNAAQTREYYKSRIANLQSTIDEAQFRLEMLQKDDKQWRIAESTIRLNTYNINQLKKEESERMSQFDQVSRITVQPQVLSINLINII